MVMEMTSSFRPLALLGIAIVGLQFMAAAQSQGARPIRYATEYDWSMRPAEELGQASARTVSLPSCPPGVKGNEPEYWVLINGSEAARVTGGTCAGDGRPGARQLAGQRLAAAGDTTSSRRPPRAPAAPPPPPPPPQSGVVVVPPKELKAFARVSIRSSNLTVDFSG